VDSAGTAAKKQKLSGAKLTLHCPKCFINVDALSDEVRYPFTSFAFLYAILY
jgi:hypothetical protein